MVRDVIRVGEEGGDRSVSLTSRGNKIQVNCGRGGQKMTAILSRQGTYVGNQVTPSDPKRCQHKQVLFVFELTCEHFPDTTLSLLAPPQNGEVINEQCK